MCTNMLASMYVSYPMTSKGQVSCQAITSSVMPCAALKIMRATRPDPICRGADPEILFSAENGLPQTCSRGADPPVPMQSNIASPYIARCGLHRSFSSAGRKIVPLHGGCAKS
jgi:hypothetical protein